MTIEHEALIYRSDDEFLAAVVPFLLTGIERGEGTVVASTERNRAALAEALGGAASDVVMVPGNEVYRTPATAIAAYHDVISGFLHDGRPSVRAIGEVVYDDAPDAIDAWLRYESIAHSVFADAPLHVICPYDERSTPADLVQHAWRTHPLVRDHATRPAPSRAFEDPATLLAALPDRSAAAPSSAPRLEMVVDAVNAAEARQRVTAVLGRHLPPNRAVDASLAVSECISNAIRHGAGTAATRLWALPDAVVTEVRNEGPLIDDPLAGFRPPVFASGGGMGLWIMRQLSDGMGIDADARGPVVRLVFRR